MIPEGPGHQVGFAVVLGHGHGEGFALFDPYAGNLHAAVAVGADLHIQQAFPVRVVLEITDGKHHGASSVRGFFVFCFPGFVHGHGGAGHLQAAVHQIHAHVIIVQDFDGHFLVAVRQRAADGRQPGQPGHHRLIRGHPHRAGGDGHGAGSEPIPTVYGIHFVHEPINAFFMRSVRIGYIEQPIIAGIHSFPIGRPVHGFFHQLLEFLPFGAHLKGVNHLIPFGQAFFALEGVRQVVDFASQNGQAIGEIVHLVLPFLGQAVFFIQHVDAAAAVLFQRFIIQGMIFHDVVQRHVIVFKAVQDVVQLIFLKIVDPACQLQGGHAVIGGHAAVVARRVVGKARDRQRGGKLLGRGERIHRFRDHVQGHGLPQKNAGQQSRNKFFHRYSSQKNVSIVNASERMEEGKKGSAPFLPPAGGAPPRCGGFLPRLRR